VSREESADDRRRCFSPDGKPQEHGVVVLHAGDSGLQRALTATVTLLLCLLDGRQIILGIRDGGPDLEHVGVE